MINFKVGDKVKCINATGYSNTLQLGKIYTIIFNNHFICLEEAGGHDAFWSKDRFVLYDPCEDILQGILDE